jgi:hypothetical protein
MNKTIINRSFDSYINVIKQAQESVEMDNINEAIQKFEDSMGMYDSISEKLINFKMFNDMEQRAISAEAQVAELNAKLEELEKNSQVVEQATELEDTIQPTTEI